MLPCMTVRHAVLLDLVRMFTADAAQPKHICCNRFIDGCALQISEVGHTKVFTMRDSGPSSTDSNKGTVT